MAYSHDQSDISEQRLFVLNGELRGVSVPLESNVLRVGSSADCDVVLLDAHDSESEVSVSSDENAFALSDPFGDVHIGMRVLKSGARKTLKSGVPFVVGTTEMMVSRSLDDADTALKSYKLRSTRFACAASVAVVVLVAAVAFFNAGRSSVIAKPANIDNLSVTASVQSQKADVEVAAEAMQSELDRSGLMRLMAQADPVNGTVKVRGSVRQDEYASWRDASKWFDTRYGDTVMLDAQVDVASDTVTLPFSISAIWMGSSPRLTLHDGSQRFAGDLLPGGWRLDKIQRDSVTIWKDGESLTVPL